MIRRAVSLVEATNRCPVNNPSSALSPFDRAVTTGNGYSGAYYRQPPIHSAVTGSGDANPSPDVAYVRLNPAGSPRTTATIAQPRQTHARFGLPAAQARIDQPP